MVFYLYTMEYHAIYIFFYVIKYIYIFKIEIVEEGSGATKGCVKNKKLLRKIVR